MLCLPLENGVGLSGTVVLQVIAGADAGEATSDDQDIEMFVRHVASCLYLTGTVGLLIVFY